MTRDSLQSAARAGIPFVINMADGDLPHMPAMLTMAGISYLSKENGES